MTTCKNLAQFAKDSVARTIARKDRVPTFAIVSVGSDPASEAYVRGKIKDCNEVGIECSTFNFVETVEQSTLNEHMQLINDEYDAIILQLPLPKHLDADEALTYIDPSKDVDGLKPNSPYTPCTALGVFNWLQQNYYLPGKHVVIINRSNLVGRPLAKLLVDADATVTICHSKTKDVYSFTKKADIVVTAVGKPGFLSAFELSPGTTVVDVGINRVNGKLCGDYIHSHLDEEMNITATPVPGGVGLLTRAYLLINIVGAAYDV